MSESQLVRLLTIYTALNAQHWGYLKPNIRASNVISCYSLWSLLSWTVLEL